MADATGGVITRTHAIVRCAVTELEGIMKISDIFFLTLQLAGDEEVDYELMRLQGEGAAGGTPRRLPAHLPSSLRSPRLFRFPEIITPPFLSGLPSSTILSIRYILLSVGTVLSILAVTGIGATVQRRLRVYDPKHTPPRLEAIPKPRSSKSRQTTPSLPAPSKR